MKTDMSPGKTQIGALSQFPGKKEKGAIALDIPACARDVIRKERNAPIDIQL